MTKDSAAKNAFSAIEVMDKGSGDLISINEASKDKGLFEKIFVAESASKGVASCYRVTFFDGKDMQIKADSAAKVREILDSKNIDIAKVKNIVSIFIK